MERIRIGKLEDSGESVFLEKHSWDCSWYWGFGYLETSCSHFHFENVIPNESNKSYLIFDLGHKARINLDPKLDGWVLMELFAQAYTLKHAAELYYMGHACIGDARGLGIKKNREKAKEFNSVLEAVLGNIWKYIVKSLEGDEK